MAISCQSYHHKNQNAVSEAKLLDAVDGLPAAKEDAVNAYDCWLAVGMVRYFERTQPPP